MASITYWNRLEPRPRTEAIAETLAARVRDPLWLLTRQWQFGEFRGADAGSPAFVTLTLQESPFVAWRAGGMTPQPLTRGAPLERQVLAEPYPSDDLSLAVELGQLFESLLREAGHLTLPGTLIEAFRTDYPIPVRPEAELAAMPDQEQARFLRVCGGRALDGVALYQASGALPVLPPRPVIAPAHEAAVRAALTDFRAWVETTWGPLGVADSPAWDPPRLAHGLDVIAASPTGGTIALSADPGADGDFDWDAFDLRAAPAPEPGQPTVTTTTISVIPTTVRFRGMPNARWWSFEAGAVDFGDLKPEKRDLARLILMDFMLIHGNDWFLIPVEQTVGSLCRVESLVIRDVFGSRTLVERADSGAAVQGTRWTMFSTAIEGVGDRTAEFFVLPPSAATALQRGTAVEEVRFLRDELANMAWAIEHATANAVGDAWSGHERDQRLRAGEPPEPAPAAGPGSPPLRYRLQTRVPEHWLPLLPVAIDPVRAEIALELGAMLRPVPGGPAQPVLPVGRFLRPTRLAGAAYRIREEEVPRAGTRVSRIVCRARWHDGSTHVWIQRRRAIGGGEGSSGLRFDLAILQRPAETP
jgi:hypothetical protein